jgi:uncharacterized cupredoxin-like copper-binding protein
MTLEHRNHTLVLNQETAAYVDLSKPGKYLLVCNLPAHFKQRMFAVVTVSQ